MQDHNVPKMSLLGPHEHCVADLVFPALQKLLTANASAGAVRALKQSRARGIKRAKSVRAN